MHSHLLQSVAFASHLKYLLYHRPPQISEYATQDNRRDFSLKIEMRL